MKSTKKDSMIYMTFDKYLQLESETLALRSLLNSISTIADDQIHFMEGNGILDEYVQREWALRYLLHDMADVFKALEHVIDDIAGSHDKEKARCL